jgi:excisionase family DNA binding protein
MESANLPRPINATLDEAARYLKVSRRCVQNWQDRGLLKPIYFGRRRLFPWVELEKLARKGV